MRDCTGQHMCDTPSFVAELGTSWTCKECGREWVAVEMDDRTASLIVRRGITSNFRAWRSGPPSPAPDSPSASEAPTEPTRLVSGSQSARAGSAGGAS